MSFLAPEVEDRRVTDYYKVGEEIGSGGFGKVYAGTCKETGISVSWFGCLSVSQSGVILTVM